MGFNITLYPAGAPKLTDVIRLGIDNKYFMLLLLFEFSKVFDSIPSAQHLAKIGGFFPEPLFRGLTAIYLI